MRIRWRLALYGAGVAAVTMTVFGVLLAILANAAAPSDQAKALAEVAAETATSIRDADPELLAGSDPALHTDIATSLESYITIYRRDGTPLYTTGKVDGETPALPAAAIVEAIENGHSSVVYDAGGVVEVRAEARPWEVNGEVAGVVVAAQPTEFVDDQLQGLGAVLWFSGLITLIAAVIVSWFVSRRALRPLRDLAATTDEIGATGDLSRRLPPVASRDEVGRLTTSFNTMLERLEAAQTRLAASLETQRRFVADASHELRSPLTTIRSNAGFLADHPDASPQDVTEALEDIAAEADRMTRLVDDLLTLAAADAGRVTEERPVELAAVLRGLQRRLATLDRPVTLDVAGPCVVRGDEDALGRLAWILIDNAARHGAGPITVSLRRNQESATLTVSDEGPGLPDGELGRVFERFYRADPARSPAGSGLGLAIAAEITRAHGGTIAAANDGGAVVTVTLPLV